MWLLPKLKDKNSYFRLSKNSYFKHLGDEDIFQFFVVNILRQNGYTVVVNEKSSKKSLFEMYKYKAVGNVSGVPDLFVHASNTHSQGVYLELKSSVNKVFKKNGEYRKHKKDSTIYNQIKFIDKIEIYKAYFVYPENLKKILISHFGIEI